MAIKLDVTKELIKELNIATVKLLNNYKLGKSDLAKSATYDFNDDAFILIANDYFQFVDSGRKPMAKKVPVMDIIKWMKKKGITPSYGHTYNSIAFAITESIYKHGIKARHFIDPIVTVSLDILAAELSEELSITIADALAKQLTKTLK